MRLIVSLGLVALSRGLEVEVSVDGVTAASDCVNLHDECEQWADAGECNENPGFMLAECAPACNVCPTGLSMSHVHSLPECKNAEKDCGLWAAQGECSKNPSYMITSCAAACRTCHLIDPEVRCRPMPGRAAAMGPGDLNATFARAIADFPELEPRVLSTDPWVGHCWALVAMAAASYF